jgi:translation elongation factor EF-4
MESQQMMELPLDMKTSMARLDENAKNMIEKMDANREQSKDDVEQILAKMKERMTATQAKTDGKVKDLTETIEKTLTEPNQEMFQSAEEHQ